MKKIFSLILAGIMMVSMTACRNNDEFGDKTVPVPAMELTTQEVTYNTAAGVELKDTLAVSPLTYDKYQPENILENLQKLDYLKGWTCTTSKSEVGYPCITENGQLTAYKYSETTTLHEVQADRTTHQSVAVSYTSDTDAVIGYSDISVSIQYSTSSANLSQNQMRDILEVVYGKDYADFLCYATMQKNDGYAEYKVQEGDAVVVLSRNTENYGIDFRVACKNVSKNVTNGYAGDYTPMLETLHILPDLMNWGEGETDVRNMSTLGKSFLEKHFGAGATFVIGTSLSEQLAGGYAYDEEENDGVSKSVHMQYRIAQPGVKESQRLKTQMTYKISEEKTESYVSLELGTINKDDLTDENRNAMIAKALGIVKDIVQTDDVLTAFDSDKYFTITVDGTETHIRFTLHFNPDKDGNEKVSMQFGASTDIHDLKDT